MSIKAKLFNKGSLRTINKTQLKALLGETTNPGAIHTYKQIMVLNNENKTFTLVEKAEIELLINRDEKGGKNVTKSGN